MNKELNILIKSDLHRYNGGAGSYLKRFHKHFRCAQNAKNFFSKLYHKFMLKIIREKNGLEIPYNLRVGKGLYIGHPYNITINSKSILGDNINIHKGATIGQENRGKRKGCPIIGNCVYIGINATVVGNIEIGDDVLIAPNAYVNCDVPSHSVVVGNPCIIKSCEWATEGYINNTV